MKKFISIKNLLVNVDEIQCVTASDTNGKLYIRDFDVIILNALEAKQLVKQLAEMEWIDGVKEH
jgi:hypothetical protein